MVDSGSIPARPPRTRQRSYGVASLAVLAVVLVALGCSSGGSSSTSGKPTTTTAPSGAGSSATTPRVRSASAAIVAENRKKGTPDWKIIDGGDDRPRGIEGFADRTSATVGQRVSLYVSTPAPSFRAIAYRMGWYGGAGGRQVWSSSTVGGVDQPTCPTDPTTRTVSCTNWARSITVKLTAAWVPGEYLIKLVPSTGSSSYVPLVVRDDASHATVLVVSSVTTTQAYNTWGGHSLYTGDGTGTPGGRAYVVSFDRPYGSGWAQSGSILGDTWDLVTMLESQGVDVTYATDIDLHQRPQLLRNHKVIISGSHDEYYSSAMRSGLLGARDHGVNIIFLGANAMYRHIRLEDSPLGPDRLEVNYRDASLDPLNGVNPAEVTTQWGDPPVPRPENAITGNTYTCNEPGLTADMVVVNPVPWMFAGTGIEAGDHLPAMVREEYDRLALLPGVPPKVELITHSPLTCRGKASYSDMVYSTVPSGAGVLAVGTLLFEPHLGPLCTTPGLAAPPSRTDCQVRRLITNVVRVFAAGPAGRTHPAKANGARFDVPTTSPVIGGD